jgi:hypothetical protein
MRYHFFALYIIWLLTGNSIVIAQKVKEVKAFRIDAGQTERHLQLHEKYDNRGNLIYSYQPDLYCTMEYSFDEQNRLMRSYQMCGESFWNGSMIYSYPAKNLVVVRSEEMVGGNYLRRDTLNAENRIQASWSYWVQEDKAGDSMITHIRHTYSPKGLLLRTHTQIITYNKQNPKIPDSRTDDFEEFEYDTRDSLTVKYVYSDNPQQKRMVYQASYDSLSGKLIESYEQPYAESGITRKEYSYDEQGRLHHLKNWYLPSEDAEWMMTREVVYRYPNEHERIEVWRSYYQNTFDSEEVRTFQNDLLMRITVLDKQGQGQQLVIYEYSYYN